MPAGDAQRVWFPEMLARLKQIDFAFDDWPAVADFCSEMTEFRSELRQAKGIKDPLMKCRRCGQPLVFFDGISIRSFIFAIHKQAVISESELKQLDLSWSKYRKIHQLNKFGRAQGLDKIDKHQRTCKH